MQVVRYQLVHWRSFGVELEDPMVRDEEQQVLQWKIATPQAGEVLKQKEEAEMLV